MPPQIDASPTKDFFISILVRDVLLNAAIADLVDNSIDGALRISQETYEGLFVKVNFSGESFSIEDNCGGIPAEIAIHYAFRFGRPADMPKTKGSVGQFGVGMKRSLFKIGKNFNIVSIAESSDFILEVDVDDWRKRVDANGKEIWAFDFKELHEDVHHDIRECGTSITVTDLHESIAAEFRTENFKLRLIDDLRAKHQESLAKGLVIEVNEYTLTHDEAKLLFSSELKPIKLTKNFEFQDQPTVHVEIYAGVVKDSDPDKSGWYISCNGRMILRADKTRVTGWDEEFENVKIPKAHGQFARFRGYVRFACDNADLLPWNTTKSGLDTESTVYQAVKPEMILAMRQVIDFLNKVDSEIDSEDSLLTEAIRRAREIRLQELPERALFDFPEPQPSKPKPKENRISYTVPSERAELAKELLGVTKLKEVGERTFDYFMQMEADESA